MNSSIVGLQDQLVAAMTPQRRLEISDGLRRTAWELKAAWISGQHPHLSPGEVQTRVRQLFTNVHA